MTPSGLRREMRRRKKELRRSAVLMRRTARAQMDQVPAVRRERRRKRLRRAATIAALLLLAMLMRCECEQPPPPPPPEARVEAKEEVKPKAPPPPASKAKPFADRIGRQARGKYQNGEQTSPSWLDDFRLQVAARSPRLAQCFSGTDRPGALRWTTAVNEESGAVSDHGLELVGTGADLSSKQRDCVLSALASPGYRIKHKQQQSLPSRISIVIEF